MCIIFEKAQHRRERGVWTPAHIQLQEMSIQHRFTPLKSAAWTQKTLQLFLVHNLKPLVMRKSRRRIKEFNKKEWGKSHTWTALNGKGALNPPNRYNNITYK